MMIDVVFDGRNNKVDMILIAGFFKRNERVGH